jgi:hypothetical protein
MTAAGDRSWRHMVESGTTITWEAWDQRYKPNQDWNHAWGAAPANILPRYALGVRPLEPGFARALIQPQPGSLKWIKGKVPTIRGPIEVDMQRSESSVTLAVKLPANMEGRVELGLDYVGSQVADLAVAVNGTRTSAASEDGRLVFDAVTSGSHTFEVRWAGG